MSYYLATFGPPPDLVGIRGLSVVRAGNMPVIAKPTLIELSRVYKVGHAHFVVDETGDTAHELLNEAWPLGTNGAVLDGTRLNELVIRAESNRAAIAIWDATWSPSTDGPPELLAEYDAFRKYLMRCSDLWDIGGAICVPK